MSNWSSLIFSTSVFSLSQVPVSQTTDAFSFAKKKLATSVALQMRKAVSSIRQRVRNTLITYFLSFENNQLA